MAKASKQGMGPPKLSAAAHLKKLREANMEGGDFQRADLERQEQSLREMYQRWFDPTRLDGGQPRRQALHVEADRRAGFPSAATVRIILTVARGIARSLVARAAERGRASWSRPPTAMVAGGDQQAPARPAQVGSGAPSPWFPPRLCMCRGGAGPGAGALPGQVPGRRRAPAGALSGQVPGRRRATRRGAVGPGAGALSGQVPGRRRAAGPGAGATPGHRSYLSGARWRLLLESARISASLDTPEHEGPRRDAATARSRAAKRALTLPRNGRSLRRETRTEGQGSA